MVSSTKRKSRQVQAPSDPGRFFFDRTDMLMAITDERFAITAVNPAWTRMFGPLGQGLVGGQLKTIIPAVILAEIDRADRHRGAAARPMFPVQVEGDSQCWLEADLTRRDDEILVVLIDVTQNRIQSGAVEEARRSRDLLLHDAGVGTWRFDPDQELFHFSPELLADYEQPQPVVPRALMDAQCHPDDLMIERPLRARLTREAGTGEMELRLRSVDESGWKHIRVLMRSGRRLASGRYELYGLTQAVTELAQARDGARANAERLRVALNAAGAGVFDIDFAGGSVWCSPEYVAMLGEALTFEEVLEGGWKVMHPDDVPAFKAMNGKWGASGYESIDVRASGPAGERWIRIYCDIERGPDNHAIKGVGLVLDVDERKRQELALVDAQRTAQGATAAKSAFLASVSHEIRTPMNGIVGVLHLLKNEAISEDGRKLLDEALACSGMLSQLINDVLDFSKIEAGKLELTPEPTHVADSVRGVVGLLEPQAKARGLYLQVEIEPGLDWVLIDPVRLRQCLFNLIGNAVKFTLRGGVQVRLSRPSAASDRLRIEVEDTGVGIPECAKARMFDRFEQADHTTTRNFNGTGLGLAISRSLAQMMGGDIGFESQEGQGSVFWLEVVAPTTRAENENRVPNDAAVLDGLRILVVDDNATNRLIGAKIVETLGAAAGACEDGESAVAAAMEGQYDLILMDVNMPGMDGLEATRRIRALPGARGCVPILALTANVMAHQRQSYLAAGMNGVVAKPFSPALLLDEITRLFADDPDQPERLTAS